MLEGYAPGYAQDAISMMAARRAGDRAAFVMPHLNPAVTLLDVGCGPGTITTGLLPAARVIAVDSEPSQLVHARRRHPRSKVEFLAASAYALPLDDSSIDIVFAHALIEHLADPARALGEFRRVLRTGGLLALSTSDWSRAKLRPKTANVDAALRGHYLLRRRAGGDPFAGKHLPGQVQQAGFTDIRTHTRYRVDQSYKDLAGYVEQRLIAALQQDTPDRDQLASAARSAWTWSRGPSGDFTQCWVEVLATK
ncbi:methyltransferase domain-containing protein [Amycolatopsis sp. cg5]|uniref:methyltransferase domain-containing protein n=1 Tax=Amycolatopsis sp. cg5 TaxID=3238802 RepID=UPI003524A2EB